MTIGASGQQTINLTDYFYGYTNSPVFTAEVMPYIQGNYQAASVSADITGNTLTLIALSNGLATVYVSVKDAEEATMKRTFHVAVTGGASKKGDANCDGVVDVADITAIASFILGENPANFNRTNADANNDGEIDVADITATASIILGE